MNRISRYTICMVLVCLCVVPGFADEWEYYIPIKGIEDVIFVDSEVYCSTGSGLFILDNEDFTYRRVTSVEGFPAFAAIALVRESDNTLLVATEIPGDTLQGSGVYRYNLDNGDWQKLEDHYLEQGMGPGPYILDMERDKDGNVGCAGIGGREAFFLAAGASLVKQTDDTNLPGGYNNAMSLAVDTNGDVVMSYNSETGSGIARRKNDIWVTVLELPGYAVGNLVIDADGTIWFSQGGSVYAYDGISLLNYDISEVGGYFGVGGLAVPSDSSVWCAGKNRLVRIYGGEEEDMTAGFLEELEQRISPLPFRSFKSVYANGGDIWVIAYCGVGNEWYEVPGKYSNEGWSFFVPDSNLIYPYRSIAPSDIAVDTTGTLWMAGFFTMFGEPLVSFDGTSWSIHGVNNIYDIAVDGENRIWLFGARTHYYENGEWTTFTREDYPIFSDWMRAGTVTSSCAWMGDGHGNVYKYEFGSEWIRYDAAYIGTDFITSVAADDRWGVWVTGFGGIASYFNGDEWTMYNSDNSGLPEKNVKFVAYDKNGTVWFATGSGLVSFDGSSWEVFDTSNSGLPDDRVNSVMTALNGDLWISTRGGLCRYDGDVWEAFTKDNAPLPSGSIRETAESPDGSIWIADERGLCRYIPDTVTSVNAHNERQPSALSITGAYPNPFNGSVAIEFMLPASDNVLFEVYNLAGQRVYSRAMNMLSTDRHRVIWDSHTDNGRRAAAGLYFIRIHAAEVSATAKVMYLK